MTGFSEYWRGPLLLHFGQVLHTLVQLLAVYHACSLVFNDFDNGLLHLALLWQQIVDFFLDLLVNAFCKFFELSWCKFNYMLYERLLLVLFSIDWRISNYDLFTLLWFREMHSSFWTDHVSILSLSKLQIFLSNSPWTCLPNSNLLLLSITSFFFNFPRDVLSNSK